jgi:C_GCAxxG_C_C family probable redox protein
MDMTSELQRLRESAESYYLSGDFRCAETVMKVILENFETEMPECIWNMASGFPGGIGGSGCVCGALAGGTMALGMFFGRTGPEDKAVPRSMQLSHELHDIFKANHKGTCCRVLIKRLQVGSPEHKKQCAKITAEMVVETAKIIIREKGADVLKR